MTTDVSIYNSFPTSDELKNLQLIATTAYKSGLYKGSPEAIIMTLLSARELNIGPMMALNGGIWNIQGKVEISARLMSALIRRAGHSFSFEFIREKKTVKAKIPKTSIIKDAEISVTKCTIKGKRLDCDDFSEASFTIEEAEKCDLILVDGTWVRYTEDMLYARALSRFARRLFPDVIGNCYVEGEISDSKKEDKAIASLPEAESEEIISQETINENIPEPIKLVDATQSYELLRMRSMLSEGDKELFDNWVVKIYMINSLEQLPESAYEKVLLILRKKVPNENS